MVYSDVDSLLCNKILKLKISTKIHMVCTQGPFVENMMKIQINLSNFQSKNEDVYKFCTKNDLKVTNP